MVARVGDLVVYRDIHPIVRVLYFLGDIVQVLLRCVLVHELARLGADIVLLLLGLLVDRLLEITHQSVTGETGISGSVSIKSMSRQSPC